MWIGSQDGLIRWDGRTAISLNKNALPPFNLPGNHIFNIEIDPEKKDIIWVLSSEGLICIDTKSSHIIKTIETQRKYGGITFETSTKFNITSKDFWLGTYKGLCLLSRQSKQIFYPKWLPYNPSKEIQNNFIDIIHIEEKKAYVFFRKYGLVVYNTETYDTLQTISSDQFKFDGIYSFQKFIDISSSGETYLLTTFESILRLQKSKNTGLVTIQNVLIKNNATNTNTYSTWINSDSVYFGGSSGLYCFSLSQKKVTRITDWNNSPKNDWTLKTLKIYVDSDKNIWLGNSIGVFLLNPKLQFTQNYYLSNNSEEGLSRIYHIFPLSKDEVWISDYSGYFHLDLKKGEINKREDDGPYFFSDTIGKNLLLVSNVKGSFLYSKYKRLPIRMVFPELKFLEKEVLNSMVKLPNNKYLFASELGNGVFLWDKNRKLVNKLDKSFCNTSLRNETINGLKLLSDGKVMILCEFEVAIYDPKKNLLENFVPLSGKNKNPNGIFMDVLEKEDAFWFACYGNGLIKCNKKMNILVQLSGKQGITNLALYKILELNKNYILATSNNGLFRIDVKSLEAIEWTMGQGIQTNRFEEGVGTTAFGQVYVGGFNGLSIINPNKVPFSEKSSYVSFSDIQLKTKSGQVSFNPNSSKTQLKIQPEVEGIDVFLNIIDYFPHIKDKLEYRLLPVQQTWQSGQVLNKLSFTGLSPAKYSLQIRMKKQQSYWSPLAVLNFTVLPPWYQTTWFYLLCALAAAAIAYALYRYRLAQLTKEFQFKEQISADLHDDLGSTITSIKMFTELGVKSGSAQYYTPVKEGLAEAALALREMIWVLDNKTSNLADVFRKTESIFRPLLKIKGIALDVHFDPGLEETKLKTENKRDLYLLMKEFINNSLKYSEATAIEIKANKRGKALQIMVSDNGKGFDLLAVKRGNGLFNMETRAKRSGFQAKLQSAPGEGVQLLLTRL